MQIKNRYINRKDTMGKVILLCGKICSGKSYYSRKLRDELNAVIISPDEATYDLLNNEQGEFYDIFSKRLIKYLTKKLEKLHKQELT
jgi:dephospho-CoA kinase